MEKILLLEIPPQKYTLKKTLSNHINLVLHAGYTKSMIVDELMIDEKSVEIIPQKDSDLGGDAFLLKAIKRRSPDILMLPNVTDYNFKRSSYIASKIKEEMPDVKVVISGSEVSPANIANLSPFTFDYAQENTFAPEGIRRLLGCQISKKTLKLTPKQVRGDQGSVMGDDVGCHAELVSASNLNGNKIFKGDPLKYSDISKTTSPFLRGYLDFCFDYKFVSNITQKGCPGKCLYCRGSLFNSGHSSRRSLADIENELKLFKNRGIKLVKWMDLTFNHPQGRFVDILNLISRINNSKEMEFYAAIRGEFVDKKTVGLLKKCNFKFLEIGLQTLNYDVLNRLNRTTNLKLWLKKVKLLKDEGFNILIDLILGVFSDNFESFNNTIDVLVEEGLINDSIIHPLKVEPILMYRNFNKARDCFVPCPPRRNNSEMFRRGGLGTKQSFLRHPCNGLIFQKQAPHFILSNEGFSFDELKKSLNYGLEMGAQTSLASFQRDNSPLFTSFFKKENEIANFKAIDIPVTKLIFNTDSAAFNSPDIFKQIEKGRNDLASSVVVWFCGKNLTNKTEFIVKIFNTISTANPYNVWNIIFEDEEIIKTEFVGKIKDSIFYYPNSLDYESIYLAPLYEKEYLRTSTRFYFLIKNPEKYEKSLLYSLNELGDLYLNININKNWNVSWDLFRGYVFNFPENISKKDALRVMGEINEQNWKKGDIFFRNLYLQTLYDLNFRNVYEPLGYEENIIEISDEGIERRLFGEEMMGNEFQSIRRLVN